VNLSKKYACVSLIGPVLLSGCMTSTPALNGQLNKDMGSAVKANIQAQAVTPTPAQKANTFIPADPTRTSAARKNYRENTIPEPERINQANK